MIAFVFIFVICAPTVLSQNPTTVPGHYCFVQSPFDSSSFDLTTIQRDNEDSTVRLNETEHLRIHLCRPLKDPCNGKQNYAVCLHSDDKEIGVGKEPPKVAFESDKIVLKYTGDKCNKTHNYTVDVELKCHFSKQDKIPTNLDVVFNHVQCNFQMTIETFAACSKRKQSECNLSDKTGYYNLSSLTNLESNYMIKVNNSTSVILNVCHSLIYGKHSEQCNHETMVCLVENMNTEYPSYTRIGNLNDDMRFSPSNETLYLNLTSDTPCGKRDAKGLQTIRTSIEFICRRSDRKYKVGQRSMPQYISGIGTCHYRFAWWTAAACSENILIRQSDLGHRPCKANNLPNLLFHDFSVLEGKVVVAKSPVKDVEYQFSICAPLKNSRCTKEGTGVCSYKKGTNVAVSKGLANTNLIAEPNQIYLNYTNGDACGNNRRSHTMIIFQCLYYNERSTVMEDNPCRTVIIWGSPMVCTNTYNMFHLTSVLDYKKLLHWPLLSRYHSDYVVQDKDPYTQYYLNVGIPLVTEGFIICTKGTNACKVVRNDEGVVKNEFNLGYQESVSWVTEDGDMYLKYVNGSICREDFTKRTTTIVTFSCDVEVNAVVGHLCKTIDSGYPPTEFFIRILRILQGTPTFKEYNNCTYYFNWKSCIACFKQNDELSKECSLPKNSYEMYNFTYLLENALFKVSTTDESFGYFSARYCQDTKCNGTFVCNNQSHSGKELETKLDYRNSLVAFEFENNNQCKKDIHYNTMIEKWCEMWSGLGESFLINKEECTVGTDWDEHISDCQIKGNIIKPTKQNDRSNIPPKNSVNIPSKDGVNIPAKHSANVPPKRGAKVAPKTNLEIPPRDKQFVIGYLATTLITYVVVFVAVGIIIYKARSTPPENRPPSPVVRYSMLSRELERERRAAELP